MSFHNNSYFILDLNSNSTDKQILKKSNNMLLKIKAEIDINEEIHHELDLRIERNEHTINEATKKLTFPKKKLEEFFFWFELENETDHHFYKLLSQKNFIQAIKFLKKGIEEDELRKFKYEKNLALCFLLMLNIDYDESILLESINLWKKLIHNSSFWAEFFDKYRTKEEGLVNKDLMIEFKSEIENLIFEEYEHISSSYPKERIIEKLFTILKPQNTSIFSKYLEKYISKVNSILEKFNSMEFKDNKIGQIQKNKISENLDKLKELFNYFESLGLENESSIKILGDEVAQNLESLSIKINNQIKDYETSYKILSIALKFVESSSIKKGIETNLAIIIENREVIALNTIYELIRSAKFASALVSIDYLLKDRNTKDETKKTLRELKDKIKVNRDMDKTLMKNKPLLFDIFGFGLLLYGDIRYLTFFYIPVCPISSYNTINNYDGSTSFLGEKELDSFYYGWKVVFIAGVIIWLLSN